MCQAPARLAPPEVFLLASRFPFTRALQQAKPPAYALPYWSCNLHRADPRIGIHVSHNNNEKLTHTSVAQEQAANQFSNSLLPTRKLAPHIYSSCGSYSRRETSQLSEGDLMSHQQRRTRTAGTDKSTTKCKQETSAKKTTYRTMRDAHRKKNGSGETSYRHFSEKGNRTKNELTKGNPFITTSSSQQTRTFDA